MDISLFAGCSYTAGTGFSLNKDEPGLWVNLLHKNIKVLNKTKLLNVAKTGRSNAGIFQDAVYNILHNDNVKYVFVAWTTALRYELSIGLEWYPTRAVLAPGAIQIPHNLNSINYPASYIQNINDRLVTMAHPHYELVNLLHYVNSLVSLCKLKNCQLFFINALCEWDKNYFLKKNNVMPEDYTKYTKQLLSISTRDDEEIFLLYEKIHNEYTEAGGIQPDTWLNLYSSLRSLLTDTNNDNVHPGLQSNLNYYHYLFKALELKLM